MKFFVDTAEIKEIKELAATGLLDGVTTNPSLIAKSGRDFKEVIAEICAAVEGPVSAEVTALDADTMVAEGKKLAKIAKNVAVKVPLTFDGLKACRTLSQAGTMVNVTLCFSANQALLAAKAGATFISPFIGRLDCPLILLQGLEDKVVPPDQSLKMFEAVKAKGIPVAYVPFEGEQHGFRQAANIQRAMEAELYFLSKVFDFPLADDIAPVEIANEGSLTRR